jgi:hypothetical protein
VPYFQHVEFEVERRVLWEDVLPKLRSRFLSEELEIQFIDVHVGETVDQHLDGKAFSRHLDIIADCHRISMGPMLLVSFDTKTHLGC